MCSAGSRGSVRESPFLPSSRNVLTRRLRKRLLCPGAEVGSRPACGSLPLLLRLAPRRRWLDTLQRRLPAALTTAVLGQGCGLDSLDTLKNGGGGPCPGPAPAPWAAPAAVGEGA